MPADPVAIKAQVVGAMATRANLEVLTAGREVVQRSSKRWRRVTDADPCGWCAMLAGRGPVYRSAVKAGDGNRYHGHCGCTAEPFEGDPDSWEPTPDEQRFIDAYEAVHEPGMSGEETAARMQAWLDGNPAVATSHTKTFAGVLADYVPPSKLGTLAEVEEALRAYTRGGMASQIKLRGIGVDNANEVMVALDRLFAAFPQMRKLDQIIAISPDTKIGRMVLHGGDSSMAAYEFIYNRLYLSTKVLKNPKTLAAFAEQSKASEAYLRANYSRLSPSQKLVADRYFEAGRQVVDGDSIDGIVTHEMGHSVWSDLSRDKATRPFLDDLKASWEEHAVKVSGYARTDFKEYFAESFAAFCKGEASAIDPKLADYFTSLLA